MAEQPDDALFIQNKETYSIISHECEYHTALNKADKLLSSKNREILALNRIIKNLKQEMKELGDAKDRYERDNHELKQEIEALRRAIREMEM